MAVAVVWVLPGMLPANMRVAPNSPSARAKLRIAPAMMDLAASGIEMSSNNLSFPAPSTRAASSMSLSMPWNPVLADWYMSGKATTMAAMTAAHQVNIIGCWKSHSIPLPTGLLRPKITINRKPTTDGGSTSGNKNIVSRMDLPLNLELDIFFPRKIPRMMTTMLETSAISMDSLIGDQKSIVMLFNLFFIQWKFIANIVKCILKADVLRNCDGGLV